MDPMKNVADLSALADRFRGPISSRREYDSAVASLNRVLDAGAMDEMHPLAPVARELGQLISAYESQLAHEPPPSGRQTLQFLMDQHGLTVAELPELGSAQDAVEILNGNKNLTPEQLSALATRFKVAPAAFA